MKTQSHTKNVRAWRKTALIVSLLLAFLFPLFLPAAPSQGFQRLSTTEMSVKLVRTIGNATSLSVELTGNFRLEETNQTFTNVTTRVQVEQGQLALYEGTEAIYRGSTVTFAPHTYGLDQVVKVNGHPYLGKMTFTLENGQFVRPINTLPMEDYLKGVVPNEMPATWEMEALKAQAIAARTYAARRAGQIVDDTINYQVYGGYKWHERASRAVDETRGLTLTHDGHWIDAVYSSSNGGAIEASASLWQPLPYLIAKEDPFDPKNPWTLSFQKTQLSLEDKDLNQASLWWEQAQEADAANSAGIKNWLRQNGYENEPIKIVAIADLSFAPERTPGQRVTKARLGLDILKLRSDGSAQLEQRTFHDVPAAALRTMLGGSNAFKSLLIDSVQLENDRWTIHGKGYGHAVGMSQYGANEMARQGKSAQEIVAFYYPGATLTQIDSGTVTVASPTTAPTSAPTTAPSAPSATTAPQATDLTAQPTAALASRSANLNRTGVIRASVLVGLRSEPSFKIEPIVVMQNGDPVRLLEKRDRWYRVQHVPTGAIGYVADDFVR